MKRFGFLVFFCLFGLVVIGCTSRRTHSYSRSEISVSTGGPSTKNLQRNVEKISRMRLPYSFGGSSPADGGMDCSGSIQYLLKQSGFTNVPRTSYAQYDWVKQHSRLKKSKTIEASKLHYGDLIFWGGTYDSGHKVSHVMLYLGQQADGKLHMYGARSKKLRGLNGGGVDIHELRSGEHKNLIGFGRIPGL